MAATAADIAFILKMQDQASGVVNAFTGNLKNTGAGAAAATTQVNQTTAAVGNVAKALAAVKETGLKNVGDAARTAATALNGVNGDAVKQTGEAAVGAGAKVIDFADAVAKLNDKLDKIKPGQLKPVKEEASGAEGAIGKVRTAVEGLVQAFVGIYASNHILRETTGEFREYETAVNKVVNTTQLAGAALTDYQQRLDAASRNLKGVGTEALAEYSQVAGQLGIRGGENIVAFASTIGKLAAVTDVAGHEGAQSLGRLLLLTGEGAEGAGKFADVLVTLAQGSKASASEILSLTSMVAQNAAMFKLSATTIAGFGAAAAQLNLQPMLFGSIFGRTLLALKDGALNATSGMRVLTSSLGTTREAFLELLNKDPATAFERFASVLGTMNKAGLSTTGFLAEFNLQGEEAQRILGVTADKLGVFQEKRKEAEEAAKTPGRLDSTFDRLQATLDPQMKGVSGAVSLLMKDIGEAIAPAIKLISTGLAGAVNLVDAAFNALGTPIKFVVALIATLGPALLAVKGAFAALNVVVGFVGGWSTLFAPLLDILIPIGAALATIVGATVGVAAAVAAALAAVAAVGFVVYQNWKEISEYVAGTRIGQMATATWGAITGIVTGAWGAILDYFKGNSVQGALEVGFNAAFDNITRQFRAFGTYLSQAWQATKDTFTAPWSSTAATPWPTWNKEMAEGQRLAIEQAKAAAAERIKIAEEEGKATAGAHAHGVEAANENRPIFALSVVNKQAVTTLDQIANIREQIVGAENALKALEEGSKKVTLTGDPLKDGDARSEAEIARLRALNELRKRQLDPVTEMIRLQGIELTTLAAVTAEQKNRVEIETKIREETEKRGVLQDGEEARIRASTAALQAQRLANAVEDQTRNMRNQLETATAVGEAAKQRVEIEQKIAEFIRTTGNAGPEAIQKYRESLQALNQANAFAGLRSSLDTVGAAQRKLADDAAVIARQSNLTLEERKDLFDQLLRANLAATNPLAAQSKLMSDQIVLAGISGDYAKADTDTQNKLNELRDKGVKVSKEQVDALREANRAMQDLQKSKSSGLEGWADGVGSIRDNLLDLQKDFASGLSSAISGAITGNKTSFKDMAKQFAGQFVKMSVDQGLKSLLGGDKIQNLFGLGTDEASKKAQEAADKVKALSPQSVTMTAGQVFINGNPLSGSGVSLPGNDNAVILPGTTARNVSAGVSSAGFGLGGVTTGALGITAGALGTAGSGFSTTAATNSIDAAAALLRSKEGFISKAQWDVNHQRVGYGSDTKTTLDGKVSTVTADTTVTREEAEADLKRRIAAQQAAMRDQLGNGALDKFSTAGQGALTSVAYNYGSLPNRILPAVRSGNPEAAAQAVESLKGDNGGVNAARRQQEADMIRSARATQDTLRQVQEQGGQSQVAAVKSGADGLQQASQTTGQAMQDLGTKVQGAGTAAETAAPSTGQVASGVGNLASQATNAIPGLKGFGGILGSLVQSLVNGGSGGSGGFGEVGKIGTALAGLFHQGGVVGAGAPASGFRLVGGSWSGAPRFHTGGGDGASLNHGEYRALLQKGERVLTANDDQRTTALIQGVGAMQSGRASSAGTVTNHTSVAPTFGFNITMAGSSGDADQDKQHAQDTAAITSEHVNAAMSSWVANEQRPGGSLYAAGAGRG